MDRPASSLHPDGAALTTLDTSTAAVSRRLSRSGASSRMPIMSKVSCMVLALLAMACSKVDTRRPQTSTPASAPAVAPVRQASSIPASEPQPSADPEATAGGSCVATSECSSGQVCTTESGACEPPPGCKPGDMCATVCYGTCVVAAEPPSKDATVECGGNDDCRLHANYCDTCRCDALRADAEAPTCSGAKVDCFVDPCRGKVARCVNSACTTAPQ